MKKFQPLMIWFLPLIVIGGIFVPALGYLVLAMMVFFLTLSFFKPRYWCWNLCPRGSFLDIVLSRMSLNRPIPKVFSKPWFRWLIFVVFISFFIFRLSRAGANWVAIGMVFVGMCILTTVISIILGVSTRHRSWCAICPMGTLQEAVGKAAKKIKEKKPF